MFLKRTVFSFGLTAFLLGCGTLPASGPYGTNMKNGNLKIDISSIDQGGKTFRYAVANLDQPLLSFLSKYAPEVAQKEDWPENQVVEEIKVNVGDTIQISIFESQSGGLFIPEDSSVRPGNFVSLPSQTIDYTGMITVPYAGLVQAAGKTTEEISADIVTRLSNKAIEPQVVVSFSGRDGAEVSVIGDVNQASRLSLGFNKYKMLDAIAAAGGPTSPGFETKVSLQRAGEEYNIRFDKLVEDSENNIFAKVNDTIYLYREPEIFIAYGAVQNQGSISFGKRKLNLSEALGLANGLDDGRADPAEVYIYRQRKYPYFEKLSSVETGTSNVMTTITAGSLAYGVETFDENEQVNINTAAPQLVFNADGVASVTSTTQNNVVTNDTVSLSSASDVYHLDPISAEDLAQIQDSNKIKLTPITPVIPGATVNRVISTPQAIAPSPVYSPLPTVSPARVSVAPETISEKTPVINVLDVPKVTTQSNVRVSTPVQMGDRGDVKPQFRPSTLPRISRPDLATSSTLRAVAVTQPIDVQPVVEAQAPIIVEVPVVQADSLEEPIIATPEVTDLQLVFGEASKKLDNTADTVVVDTVKPVVIEKVYNQEVPFMSERGIEIPEINTATPTVIAEPVIAVETPVIEVPAPMPIPAPAPIILKPVPQIVEAPAPVVKPSPLRQPKLEVQEVTETATMVTSDDGVSMIFRLDMRDPKSFFLAQNFQMEDQDIIYVANAKSVEFSKFLNILNLSSTTTNATDVAKDRF